jgi:chromosome segregation ATPase
MPIIAASTATLPAITAINPILGGAIVAAGILALILKKAHHPQEEKNKPHHPSSAVKKITQAAHSLHKQTQSNEKKEKKQYQLIQNEIKKEKRNTQDIADCTQNLKKTTYHLETQTEISRQKLQEIERLQQSLILTQEKLQATQKQLELREKEITELTLKLSEINFKFEQAVKTNTKTSTVVIDKALSTQKAQQETIDPLLRSKDKKIAELTNEIATLRKTLREINHRLIEANKSDTPSFSSANTHLFSSENSKTQHASAFKSAVGGYNK